MTIYYCKDCGMFFTENQMEEKEICYEELYGIAGDFHTKTYTTVGCCPHCMSIEYEEETDEDNIIELLNR